MITVMFTPPPIEDGVENQKIFLNELKGYRKTASKDELESYDFAIKMTEFDIAMLEAEQPKKERLAA